MTDYAALDANGNVLGFHNSKLVKPPADAVELTAEQYATWVQNPAGFIWHAPTKSLVAAPPRATAAPAVAGVVTKFQIKAALLAMPGAETGKTLLDDVDAWVASESRLLQLGWAEAAMVRRSGALITQAAAHFGWSSAQLDGMFQAAAAIAA